MWGSMDPTQDSALDMTLGFPADTLPWAGLKGVPQDGMLTVAVRGTAEKPKIDWQGCAFYMILHEGGWKHVLHDSCSPEEPLPA